MLEEKHVRSVKVKGQRGAVLCYPNYREGVVVVVPVPEGEEAEGPGLGEL